MVQERIESKNRTEDDAVQFMQTLFQRCHSGVNDAYLASVCAPDGKLVGMEKRLCADYKEDSNFEAEKVADDLYLCTGSFVLAIATEEGGSRRFNSHRQFSALVRKQGNSFVCLHIHCSDTSEEERRGNQLQTVLDAIDGGMNTVLIDDVYTYIYVSDELCRMFGYTHDEYLKVTEGSAQKAIYPPDIKRVSEEMGQFWASGSESFSVRYRIPCKDGSLKWIINSGRMAEDELGRKVINSIYLDITEFENTNQELARQKEQLDSIYDSIICGIVRYRLEDHEFQCMMMNREAMKLMGYQKKDSCLSMNLDDFLTHVYEEDRPVLLHKIQKLQEEGGRFQSEYRILAPERPLTWVYGTVERLLDTDGRPLIQHTMIDITDKKHLELNLEEERQRFRIAIESAPSIIFEYDISTDTYRAFGNLEDTKKHTLEYMVSDFLKEHINEVVGKEYQDVFANLLLGKGDRDLELLMAPYVGADRNVWARIRVIPVIGIDGGYSKIIGKINDIQSEKEKEFALEDAKSRDGLTGLYTRDAGIRLVKEYMERKSPSEVCAMMLLDMDNFGLINEEEGGMFADAILQETATILCSETGPEDIQIRLGGDEFMLFVKNCNKDRATVLGPRIASLVGGLFVKEDREIRVSVSIGMCVTAVVDDYSGLYRCAESTLKYVKSNQKGQAACYLDTSNELGVMLTQLYTEEHFINKVDSYGKTSESDLTSFALELLGKSKSLEDAIYLLLARIGKTYHLDRVSVMETDYDYLSYRFTYQWAKDTANLQTGHDFYLSREEFDKAAQMYDESGVCDHNINSSISPIASCIHAGIWNQGIYMGSLSFEINQPDYRWTSQQRKFVRELVRVIFSFILKARADAVNRAKTDFLSRMSHEIRTPMNAITGMTAIAKTVLDDKERAMDCLNKIESSNAYLLELINDVLDMSRIESGKIELNLTSVSLGQQLDDLAALMRPQAELKHIDFRLENLCNTLPPVMADALRLNQILVNIVGNAVKFTNEYGCILLKARLLLQTPSSVTVRFSVKDNGIGISDEEARRIFTAFEQAAKDTSSEYGGTGLGLSISSLLVQLMGGFLEVSSEVGKGSEFYFTLEFPFADHLSENSSDLPESDNPTSHRNMDFTGKRLLVAEDNELNREIAGTLLEMEGFTVETADDGAEALQMFKNHAPHYYDGILMDIRMPVMDGLEATKQIRTSDRADSRTIPIIAMTANAFDEDTKKSMESGMNGHLSKPVEIDKLFTLLAKCLS